VISGTTSVHIKSFSSVKQGVLSILQSLLAWDMFLSTIGLDGYFSWLCGFMR